MVYSNRRDHTLVGVRREQDVPILAVGIEAARGGVLYFSETCGGTSASWEVFAWYTYSKVYPRFLGLFPACKLISPADNPVQDSWGRGGGPSFAPKGVGPLLEPPRPPKGPTKPCWPTRTIGASALRYVGTVRQEKVTF